jgi:hypothetical protein
MPKSLMIVLTVAALAIAACHSNSSGSSPTPPTTSPTFTPNPKITKATVLVTIFGTPAPDVPVEASTPKSQSSPRPGKPFETKDTGKKGLVTFTHLKPSKTYCWVAVLGPHQTSSQCAGFAIWQNGTISLGT